MPGKSSNDWKNAGEKFQRLEIPDRGTRLNMTVMLFSALALLTAVLVRNAWVCDDAYITFRCADNWIHGYGLVWNAAERVQAYTHPLWLFLFSGVYYFTREAYFTALVLSGVFTVAAVALLLAGTGRSAWLIGAGMIGLLMSKAFIDYASSGLENPLSYFLAACWLMALWKAGESPEPRRIFAALLCSVLLVLNRLDYALLVAPASLALCTSSIRTSGWWKTVRIVFSAALPLIGWEFFSMLYYGSPVPNTAYAKLNTGISTGAYARQGVAYLMDSWIKDPVTLSICALALLPALRKSGLRRRVAVGGLLYLIYIVRIGGDFMSGRFLAILCFISVGLLLRENLRPWAACAIAALLLFMGLRSDCSPVRTTASYTLKDDWRTTGISDERGAYYPQTGLLTWHKGLTMPNHPWMLEGAADRAALTPGEHSVKVKYAVGFYGYAVGPGVHIIDEMALADPLLARLPARDTTAWRIGHFWRDVPAGYEETWRTGTNAIQNPDIARRYDLLQAAISTAHPLFDPDRLRALPHMPTAGTVSRE